MTKVTSEISEKMALLKLDLDDFRSSHKKSAPFSNDLRERVLKFVSMGICVSAVAKACGINRKQIHHWAELQKKLVSHRLPPNHAKRRVLSIIPSHQAQNDQRASDVHFSLQTGKLSINISM